MRDRLTPWIALAALFGLAALTVLLAASLPRVTFSEGAMFEERELPVQDWAAAAPTTTPLRWAGYLLAYGPLAVLFGGLIVYLVVRGHRSTGGEGKSILSSGRLLSFALFMIALALIARNQVSRNLEETLEENEPVVMQSEDVDEAAPVRPAPSAAPPSPPNEGRVASTMLQIALAIAVVGATTALLIAARRWQVKARRPAPSPTDSGAPLETALRELRWGRDPAGVVERCYRDMLKTYAKACGIDPAALTPREFARSAAEAGYGGEAMDELTSLFELVHYGRRPDDNFSQRATRCMVQLQGSLSSVSQAGA